MALRKEIEMLRGVHGVEIELISDGLPGDSDGDREGPRNLALMRIVDEALHNALRHARAQHIRVRLTDDGIEVTDDGVGFEPEKPELRSRHLGLTSMEERAREFGGTIEIRSAPGAGTTVRLRTGR